MVKIRRQLMGLGFIAASSVLAMGAAHAMNGQTNIKVDGGPLGQLEMSGGVGGYGYVMSNPADGVKQSGLDSDAFYLQVGKSTGVVQWFVKFGNGNGSDGYTPGVAPGTVSSIRQNESPDGTRGTGILDNAYATIAPPNFPVTFSAGILGGTQGYESGTAWNNVSLFASAIDYVESGNQIGVNANITEGPANLLVQFGDVDGTRVFNTLELLGNYNFNSNNVLSAFATIKLGTVGYNASGGSPVGPNSNVYGAYYSWTQGNLNLVPEIQYAYAKVNHRIGIDQFSSNLGLAVFGDYSFANSPYSLGAWAAWDKSVGNGITVYGDNDESITFAVSPTWQYKYVYARLNGAVVGLLNSSGSGTLSENYPGWTGSDKTQLIGAIDTGFVF